MKGGGEMKFKVTRANMKIMMGIVVLVSICTGVYVGGYLFLFKGLLQALNNFQYNNLLAVWGIIRVLLACPAGWGSFMLTFWILMKILKIVED